MQCNMLPLGGHLILQEITPPLSKGFFVVIPPNHGVLVFHSPCLSDFHLLHVMEEKAANHVS